MKGENCIDVKYVNSLSIPYLTRFFGSAGPIKRIEKNDNSKYVTIFAHKSSVDKAFRFEGRVLDEHPIKIKKYKEKTPIETIIQLSENPPQIVEDTNFFQNMEQREEKSSDDFKVCLWRMILRELKRYEWTETNDKIILSLFLWSLGTFEMASFKHLQMYGINLRSSYLRLELERQVIDRINRKLAQGNASVLIEGRPVNMECRKEQTLIWFNVPYPNIEEQQSKIETASQAQRCQQLINSLSPALAELYASLRSSSLCLNSDNLHELMSCTFEVTSSKDENFMGIVENIGVRDIFYEFLSFEQPNSCLYIEKKDDHPETFSCTLRLRGSGELSLAQLGWCNFYQAVVWKRWISSTEFFYHIEKKQEIEGCSLTQHNLCFEQAQFSCSGMCREYKKYQRLAKPAACRVFYMRRQIQEVSTSSFEKLYEDDMMRIDEEVKLKCEKKEEIDFHEEVVLNLVLIEVRPQGTSALNQLKLEHYLLEYIQESIVSKGLIVASKEMAFKLASNIIEREKDGRLFDFANPRFEKYIGEELWRLYNRQSERKAKNILAAYQIARK